MDGCLMAFLLPGSFVFKVATPHFCSTNVFVPQMLLSTKADEACFASVGTGIDSVTGKGTIQHMENEIHFNVLLIS